VTTQIIIREKRKNKEDFAATAQFGAQGAPHDITIKNPFSEQQEKNLEWYFEKWLNFPFTDKVPAEKAESSIRAYGEDLFEQVFNHSRHAAVEYDRLQGEDVELVIIGSPEFHALHWEALKDPHQARPLSVEKPIIRKNSKPVIHRARMKPAPKLRVLLVTARPGGERDVGYRTISRPLVEALEKGKVAARIDIVRPGTFEALVNHLENARDKHGDGYYHIIHLDMHGSLFTYEQYQKNAPDRPPGRHAFRGDYAQTDIKEYLGLKAFLFFHGADGTSDGQSNPVSADDLVRLLNMRQIPMVILNACQSGKQVGAAETSLGSQMLDAGAQLVVAMGYSVTVSAAQLLMVTLYRQLLNGQDPAAAIRRARLELFNDKRRKAAFGQEINLEDWMLPVIYQNRAPDFGRDTFQGDAMIAPDHYPAPRGLYRFAGRDVDILKIELRLLAQRNLVLIRGMGGAGKTTLIHHLGWWWKKTRFVAEVFYFGYDQKAYSVAEIVNSIGSRLGLRLSGIAEGDQATVLHALKSERHMLALDNLESITGQPLAVQNTLTLDEQTILRLFLQQLTGARTVILLGSRAGETWLRPDPLRDVDVWDLPGLDYDAQTALAEDILRTVNAPRYSEQAEHQDDFRRLLKLLGGCPLAMEVVLAGLAKATPGEIITRLQAADINLDNREAAASKTESILKCIDYSHSNLSEEAQALLLCLAPFTGVINMNLIELYTEELKKETPLAKWPFDQWPAVFKEATHWGLLEPHKKWSEAGFWSLQPILPYFLKTRLNDEPLSIRKSAIEAAFCAFYNELGGALAQALKSKDAGEKQTGQIMVEAEYENLSTALKISLDAGSNFFHVFDALGRFLQQKKQTATHLSICKRVASQQARYTSHETRHIDDFVLVNDRLAGAYFEVKDYDSAKKYYEKGLALARQSKNPHIQNMGKATALHQLGVVAHKQRQWGAAEGYYKEALKIKIEFKDVYSQAVTLHQLGMVAEEQRQWGAAEGYYKEALKIKIEFKDGYSQAATLHQLGRVAQEQRQWEAAEGYYKEALKIKIEFKDVYSQAVTLHQLGMVAQEQRQWGAAEGYYKEGLKIFIEFKDVYSQAATLHQLGRVAEEQRQWEAAEGYYKEALKIKIEFKDVYSQASTLHQLGVVAQQQQQWGAAEGYYKEGLKIFIEFKDVYSQASTLHQLGMVAQEQRQWGAAEGYYKEALKIYIEFKDRYEQAGTLHQLGMVAQDQRQWGAAAQFGLEAATIFIQYKDQNNLAIVLRGLAITWRETKDIEIPNKLGELLEMTTEEAETFLARFNKKTDQENR